MKLGHLQATAAATLLCGSVLLGNVTSYAAIGKIVKAGEVKQTESDTAARRGRVEKPIDEVYAPREAMKSRRRQSRRKRQRLCKIAQRKPRRRAGRRPRRRAPCLR